MKKYIFTAILVAVVHSAFCQVIDIKSMDLGRACRVTFITEMVHHG